MNVGELYKTYRTDLRMTLIEVNVGDTSGKYYLPDDAILRSKPIVGWSAFPPSEIFWDTDPSYSPTTPERNRPLVNSEVFYSTFINIMCGNVELFQLQALINGAKTQNNPSNVVPALLSEINPSKTFLQVSESVTPTVGTSFLLEFYYLEAGTFGR